MRLYLSGPINGRPNFVQEFREAEEQLLAAGYEVTNPTNVNACVAFDCWSKIYGGKTRYPKMQGAGMHTWECYMRFDIIALCECDAICMRPGWMKSAGSNLEYAIAVGLNMPAGCLDEWLERGNRNNEHHSR